MTLFLREELASAWKGRDIYSVLAAIEGDIYRHKEGRKTLRFELGDKSYFLKLHNGVGWKEIFKNLLQLRLPVVGAANEWLAIEACRAGGIDTLTIAGYGKEGFNPASQRSFLITDELQGIQSLEDYCRPWVKETPDYKVKKTLVSRVAAISRQFHQRGMNHRDFYLCHFLLGGEPDDNPQAALSAPIYLMDLHRAQIRRRVPRRWLIKDLGSLYYSALDCGLSRRDILRFMRVYKEQPARQTLAEDRAFWLAVRQRAVEIYRRDFGREPQLPL